MLENQECSYLSKIFLYKACARVRACFYICIEREREREREIERERESVCLRERVVVKGLLTFDNSTENILSGPLRSFD